MTNQVALSQTRDEMVTAENMYDFDLEDDITDEEYAALAADLEDDDDDEVCPRCHKTSCSGPAECGKR